MQVENPLTIYSWFLYPHFCILVSTPARGRDWSTSLNFIYFSLHWVFVIGLWSYSRCSAWLLMAVASPAVKHGSRVGPEAAALGLSRCSLGALEHAGFSSHGTRASMWHVESSGPGIKSLHLHWQADFQPLGHQGSRIVYH